MQTQPWLERVGIHYHQSVLGNEIQSQCWTSALAIYTNCLKYTGRETIYFIKEKLQLSTSWWCWEEVKSCLQFPLLFEVNVQTQTHRELIFCVWLVYGQVYLCRVKQIKANKSSTGHNISWWCNPQQSLPWGSSQSVPCSWCRRLSVSVTQITWPGIAEGTCLSSFPWQSNIVCVLVLSVVSLMQC